MKTIAGSFAGGDFARIAQRDHPGTSRVYARVLAPGDMVEVPRVLVARLADALRYAS